MKKLRFFYRFFRLYNNGAIGSCIKSFLICRGYRVYVSSDRFIGYVNS